MYPSPIALKDKLGEAYLSLALHLLYELEQAAVIGLVACDDIGCATEHVVAVLHTPDERVEFLTSIATADHYRLTPRLAYGVQQLLYQHMQQVIGALGRAVVYALALRRGASGQLLNGKIFHIFLNVIVTLAPGVNVL